MTKTMEEYHNHPVLQEQQQADQWLFTVIAAARKGLQLPTIPAIPATVQGSE